MRHAVLIAIVLAGCRQQATPLSNPFLAPDRVPPPGTRTPAPGTALPYYGGESPPPVLTPSGTGYVQPSSARVGQNESPASSTGEGPAVRVAATQPRGSTPWVTSDSPESPITIPADGDTVRDDRPAPPTGRSGTFLASRDRKTDDAFRPPSRRVTTPQSEQRRSDVRTASFEEDAATKPPARLNSPQRSASRSVPSAARYARDPEYAWLQGRLEHSRASGEWKLRYIPIDGATDDYGGSVILENPQELGDLAAGDFVRVQGVLVEQEDRSLSFAPIYRIVQIQPLAD